MLRGISVELQKLEEVGRDAFNHPIYSESWIEVQNVLVSPSASVDQTDTTNLTGDMSTYMLCVPKGDQNEWKNRLVRFWGKTWETDGEPREYIEDMLPLSWNKQISVKCYE